MNIEYINKCVIDSLEEFRGVYGLSEVRDAFIFLLTVRYIWSSVDVYSVPAEFQVENILGVGEKNICHRLRGGFESFASVNRIELVDVASCVDLISGIKEEEWDSRLYRCLKRLESIRVDKDGKNERVLLSKCLSSTLEYFAENGGKAAGESYSPIIIGKLLSAILAPKPEESVFDPACGSGGFLCSSLEFVSKHSEGKGNVSVFGEDINSSSSKISKMNLFVHGCRDFNIEVGDSVSDPKFISNGRLKEFDVIMANPPFSLKISKPYWIDADRCIEKYGDIPVSRADYAFIMQSVCRMKKGGRAAVVCSSGALSRSGKERNIREGLVKGGRVDAVVSLPGDLFYGTRISSNLLIFKNNDESDGVLFMSVGRLGDGGSARQWLTDRGVQEIVEIYKKREYRVGVSKNVTYSEIEAHDYNLNPNLYLDGESASSEICVSEVMDVQRELCERFQKLQREIEMEISS